MKFAEIPLQDLTDREKINRQYFASQVPKFPYMATYPNTTFPPEFHVNQAHYGALCSLRLPSLNTTFWAFATEGARDQFAADFGATSLGHDPEPEEPAAKKPAKAKPKAGDTK
jgi:hypothetical protein